MNIVDRKRGCLFGLACGDALGGPVEFRQMGEFSPVTDYRSGGVHGLNKGEFTDDTSMALALADSLRNGWDLKDQMDRYVAWWQNGVYSVNGWCFDIGGTTKAALSNYQISGDPLTSGLTSAHAAGNGSIMRLAPVPIKYSRLFIENYGALMEYGRDSSMVTHASPNCQSACGYLAVILGGLINGEGRESLLTDSKYMQHLSPDIFPVAQGSYRHKEPPAIKGSGYVVDSLEAALWAFYKAKDFREAVLAAVNLGDDADTTGAVCGQLAGAYWGYEGIPVEWREGLAKSDYIEGFLQGIL